MGLSCLRSIRTPAIRCIGQHYLFGDLNITEKSTQTNVGSNSAQGSVLIPTHILVVHFIPELLLLEVGNPGNNSCYKGYSKIFAGKDTYFVHAHPLSKFIEN